MGQNGTIGLILVSFSVSQYKPLSCSMMDEDMLFIFIDALISSLSRLYPYNTDLIVKHYLKHKSLRYIAAIHDLSYADVSREIIKEKSLVLQILMNL
jgi:hypothetical protein